MQTHKFIKQDNKWYIDLPGYIEKGGNFGDLQMVEGADTMLGMMAGNNDAVKLVLTECHLMVPISLCLLKSAIL